MVKCRWVIVITLFLFMAFPKFVSCFKPQDIRNYLGTRTPYRFKYNKDDSRVKYPNCGDAKIWMMIRHGTRLPSSKDVIGMNSTLNDLRYEVLLGHQAGKGKLSAEQLEALKSWSTNIEVKNQKDLTEEGGNEMKHLAERMRNRFPNAVPAKYNNETFLFRYTATQRAEQSAKYFAQGLFGKKHAKDVQFSPPTKIDPVLRFYKHCDRWQKQVKKNDETYKEQHLFGSSQQMNESIEAMSERLGLSRVLSLDEAVLMYKICGYETSWGKHAISPWCHAFDERSGQNMEYYHDLKHYWMDGYGHDITYRQACLAIKTMFDMFRDQKPQKSTFLFAHSGTLLKVLSHLQLYKPESHLRASSMDHDREWKATNIDCFATNLAFVLFKCSTGDHVLTLHQERVVKLPMCRDELCPLDEMKEYFHESLNNCDYNDMCALGKDEL